MPLNLTIKFPTLQRFYCIFAGIFFTAVLAGVAIGIARITHALLFLAIKWEGSKTSYLWLVILIFESLTIYWLINLEDDYTKSRHGIYEGIEMTKDFAHTWHRVFATLFLMLLVLIGAWIFNQALEDYHLRIPFWIQLIVPWLLLIYTELVRFAYKSQLNREA